MSIDLKHNIKSNIKKEDKVLVADTNTNIDEQEVKTFKIGKKKEDKNERKAFPLYVDAAVQKELEKIVKKTGYSRNEIINMMIQHCLDNIEFTD